MPTHIRTIFILIVFALTSGCLERNDKSAEELLLTRSNIQNKDSILVRNIRKENRSTYCLELKVLDNSGAYTNWGRTYIMLDDYNEFMLLTESPGVLIKDQPSKTQQDGVINSIINVFCHKNR